MLVRSVPENQRLSCLKFILKKEILSWNVDAIEDVEENDEKNDEKTKMSIRLMESKTQESDENENENENEILEENKNVFTEKKDSKEMKKLTSKRLLSRKEKKTVVTIETKKEQIIVEEVIARNVPQESSEMKSPYASHFSPFPSTSSPSLIRPFQAVIFADDEQLAVTVCDTVRALLSQKGDENFIFFMIFFFFVFRDDVRQFVCVCVYLLSCLFIAHFSEIIPSLSFSHSLSFSLSLFLSLSLSHTLSDSHSLSVYL